MKLKLTDLPVVYINLDEQVDRKEKLEENLNELGFKNIGDFSINGLIAQSPFLTDLKTKNEQYQKMIKQLKTNKVLKLALQDPDARQSIIDTIEALIKEIEQSDK